MMMDEKAPQQRIQAWKIALKDRGFRLTATRQTVMRILAESQKALTAQEIYDLARDQGHAVGIASVYRTLEILDELGLIQQIHQGQGCHAFGPALSGHKHFLICTECSRMVAFPGTEEVEALLREVEDRSGYEIKGHWLQLFGLCQDCQEVGSQPEM
jgi:Fur family ferric uptake transcriptional regulator